MSVIQVIYTFVRTESGNFKKIINFLVSSVDSFGNTVYW